MKKGILILIFGLLAASAVTAQSRIGGGLVYGTEIEELGINLNGEFFLKNSLAISPEFNYFFVEGDGSFWTLNGDGHFYLNRSSQASLYALAGLNLATRSFGDNSNTELGVNLGLGANLELGGSVTPFAQFKYIFSEFDQAVLSFGIRFDLN